VIIDPFELRARPSLIPELRSRPRRVRRAALRAPPRRRNARGRRRHVQVDRLAPSSTTWRQPRRVPREDRPRRVPQGARQTNPHDVRALINHDFNYPSSAVTAARQLRSRRSRRACRYDYDATDTSYARDLRALNMSRGDVTQSSFAFRIARGGDTWDEDPDTGGADPHDPRVRALSTTCRRSPTRRTRTPPRESGPAMGPTCSYSPGRTRSSRESGATGPSATECGVPAGRPALPGRSEAAATPGEGHSSWPDALVAPSKP
jgi:hypothetical protein